MSEASRWIKKSRRIILKIGTNVLAPHTEQKESRYFDELAANIALLRNMNKEVILVSSGAVGLGYQELGKGRDEIKGSLIERQALASMGQIRLMNKYREAFAKQSLACAQILVSRSDFLNRAHYKNLQNILNALLAWGVIPIVNENDAVAVEELKLGDNDTLSAHITGMEWSSFLIMLTSIDGFYVDGERQKRIDKITERHMKAATGPSSGGIGGMRTKLLAAKKILKSSQAMLICSGESPSVLEHILEGKDVGTLFVPDGASRSLSAKQRWMIHNRHTQGAVMIDDGARKALKEKNASLLAVGVSAVIEEFDKGDLITVYDERQKKVARGIARINSASLLKAKEAKAKGTELIHRNDIVLL